MTERRSRWLFAVDTTPEVDERFRLFREAERLQQLGWDAGNPHDHPPFGPVPPRTEEQRREGARYYEEAAKVWERIPGREYEARVALHHANRCLERIEIDRGGVDPAEVEFDRIVSEWRKLRGMLEDKKT